MSIATALTALADDVYAAKAAITAKGGTAPSGTADMADAIAAIPSGGITPTGNINITDTNVTDVTNYATAQVVDADLVAENIKKDVNILGIIGSFDGGGGSLPSSISKIDGGSFTLASDTEVRTYSWSHNLGVVPRIVSVWCDEITTVEPYSVAVVTDVHTTIHETEYTAANNKSALTNTIFRAANGSSSYNLTNLLLGELPSWITASTIKLNVAQYCYKAGATYKWVAYA